ncbi:MAG: hypothetical protein CL450_05885, partial [Acidimicrobiaceae bacterium]|nr:hypothetical protein [Acidimicrobiaceae bacterium]
VDSACVPWGGECLNGVTEPDQSLRTKENQCASCDTALKLADGECRESCGVTHAKSYSDGCTVSECDAGYKLDDKACTPWGGQCANGTPIAQSERTADDQCGSCDPGYDLESGVCNPTGDNEADFVEITPADYACPAGYTMVAEEACAGPNNTAVRYPFQERSEGLGAKLTLWGNRHVPQGRSPPKCFKDHTGVIKYDPFGLNECNSINYDPHPMQSCFCKKW